MLKGILLFIAGIMFGFVLAIIILELVLAGRGAK